MLKNKTLVFSPTGLMSKQFGLTIEIVENLVKTEDDIYFLRCQGVLDTCYANRVKNILACTSCQSRMDTMLSRIGISKSKQLSLQQFDEAKTTILPSFKDLDHLMSFNFHNINLGRAAASSIISYTRNYHLSSLSHGELIEIELRKAINVLLNIEYIYKNIPLDMVYLFNGRFAEVYPVLEFCNKKRIPFKTIEAGAGNKYAFFDNALPHSITERQNQMRGLWNSANEEIRIAIGNKWFVDKRSKISKLEISHTKGQKDNRLPPLFDKTKRNIVILNSSEDELKAINEWSNPIYKEQNEAIKIIAEHFENNDSFQIYLRVHPNLGKVENIQMKEILNLSSPNLVVIGPNDIVDTYALIDACEKSIALGSTAGVEATFWENVSILFGKGFYYGMDCAYEPKSYEDLFDLIEDKHLQPKSKQNTLPYGYYWSVYGQSTSYFNYNGILCSSYKKKRIRLLYVNSLIYFIKFLKYIPKWFRTYKAYTGKKLSLFSVFRYK